jgi:hypothetical protein
MFSILCRNSKVINSAEEEGSKSIMEAIRRFSAWDIRDRKAE